MTRRLRRAAPSIAFGALCYAPLLLTAPGTVVADTKSYLYLDPGRLLSRAWSMWDPHVGLGTVTHQNIGFLWPMGPYYWTMEQVGVPDWVAQRLWLGSILFAAGAGMRFLLRTWNVGGPAVAAAVCTYALTPYLLTIAVRISAILLPFAALPWLVALAVRATREGTWRHPAAFALVVTTAGTSNATSILLAGLAPALWMVWAVTTGLHPLTRVFRACLRTGITTLATSAWWIAGLSVQATNGIDVLRYTESVATTAAASSAPEVLRGLGYWFFYGDDAPGPWIGPSRPYQSSPWLLTVTFAVPVLALLAGGLARWRERSFVVALLLLGLTVAVGTFPYDAPSPAGRALRAFLQSDVGMAMRSLPRAVPLVVLALSVLVAAGIAALRNPRAATGAASGVVALAVLALPPLWQGGFAPDNLSRPEDLPPYWKVAGELLTESDDGTRVLELPGADFTSYRWGTTVDPVTPGLTDRPIVARELVPQGSAPSADLVRAFDSRLQTRTAEVTSIAPIARLLRAGQILLRSDLRYEHYDTPRPQDLRALLARAPGLGRPVELGVARPNVAPPEVPMLDELTLSLDPDLPVPHPVTVLPVAGTPKISGTKPAHAPVVLAGDGDGIVDSAASGLLDGTELVRYSAATSDAELTQALDDGAVLILTDTNRRRGARWGTVRFTSGYTEPAGHRPLARDRADARLPVFPEAGDDARTVAVHREVTANATSYGGRNEYLPETRPAHAADGDISTAWRTSRDDPVVGQRLELRYHAPITSDAVTFVAPQGRINRWITKVALRFDGGPAVVVDLDERSRLPEGQHIRLDQRTFEVVSIEVLADTGGARKRYGGLTSTGFAEVDFGGPALDEVVRPPLDLLERAGPTSVDHPLAIVLSRLRSAVTDVERSDEEPTLRRLLTLPTQRAFSIGGTARLSPRAADEVIDRTLGLPSDQATIASSRLAGPSSRASLVRDGDPTTAWSAAFGEQAGQWVEARAPASVTLHRLRVSVRTDGRHSVPTRLGVEVDGTRVATATVGHLADRTTPNATSDIEVQLPTPTTGTTVRVVVDEVRAIETIDWGTRAVRTLPVSIAELGVEELLVPPPAGVFSSGCRDDLLSIDGRPVPIEVTGTTRAAVDGDALRFESCTDQGLDLPAGEHEIRSGRGADTGIDVDRLVLRSAAGGAAATTSAPLREDAEPRGGAVRWPLVEVLADGAASVRLRVTDATAGEPLWLTFGQSWNDGWRAEIDGRDLGDPTLVDGFANGWRIEPVSSTFEVELRFAPQDRVTLATMISAVAALACLVLVLRPRRTIGSPVPTVPLLAPLAGRPPPLSIRSTVGYVAGMTALAVAVVNPAIGAVAAVLALVLARGLLPCWAEALIAPAALGTAALYVVATVALREIAPGLEWAAELSRAHPIAWLAVLSLVAHVVVAALRGTDRR